MSASKKSDLDFRKVFICLRLRTPYPPPDLHTCIRVHSILFHTGEGGKLNQREGERGSSLQSWVENTNMTDCFSSL